jgi:putative flavoprotein involved in K+ transport
MIYDVIVIGAGQAGLSMGYYLKKGNSSFLILDNNERIGDVWRKRYDSLVLFTPRSFSSLHGLTLEGDPNRFPTKNEIADYLERYANTFDLPIKFNTEVKRITKHDKTFMIHTQNSILKAKKVVVATGAFHTPNIPSLSKEVSKEVVQLHSSQYKDPSQLNEGAVLVVGGGNSGTQIAVELSLSHNTYLSVGHPIHFLPLTFFNKSIFWWFDMMGILKFSSTSFVGRRIQKQGDPIFGYELKEKMKKNKVKLNGRTVSIQNNIVTFDDLTSLKINNIIWATGFTPNYSWIDIPNLVKLNSKVHHKRGVTNIEGLYFLGLPWQHRRGSALLFGVGDDAKYLYQEMVQKNN